MDYNDLHQSIIINFVLSGGPPWGFRIKHKGGSNNKVIISKVNCGGRAQKAGLKINDEIVAVNNLEIDKHPLTLVRNLDDSDPNDADPTSIQLTKLDFTYQLIKHTFNRQLHLTVRRFKNINNDNVEPCCYFLESNGHNNHKVWSPGSTTSPGSDTSPSGPASSLPGPILTASATQTTPVKTEIKPETVSNEQQQQQNGISEISSSGFRPVKMSTSSVVHATDDSSMPATLEGGTTAMGGDVSPSSPSDMSLVDTGKCYLTPPSPDDRKYWTLPRPHHQREMSTKDEEELVSKLTSEGAKQVVTEKAPPSNAKFILESPSTKYYTLPTSHVETVRTTTLPPPPKFEGIGPVSEDGVPLALRTGVKDEYGSDWYKTMFKQLHKSDRPRSELDQPIRVKVKPNRRRDRFEADYFSEDETSSSRYLPKNIADYEPGHSSISLRERNKFYADILNYIDSIFTEVFASYMKESIANRSSEQSSSQVMSDNQQNDVPARQEPMERPFRRQMSSLQDDDTHAKNCVFNALTSNGYKSDSSYIIRKKDTKIVPTPATRSTYCAIQKGDMDIPMHGLQKPAPAPRAYKESAHRYDEKEVNIHYKSPIQQLVKSSDQFNEDDLVKFQRDLHSQRYHDNDFERRLDKDTQRRHHFTPTQDHIVHLDRYQKAYAQKDESAQILARVLFDFHALSGREISVKKGDIVIVIRPLNHNWVEIEDSQSGLKGLVPRNYLDYEQEGVAKAKYDFDAKTAVELSFKKDDVLKIFRKVDDNWFEGSNMKGENGIFPCSYVEILKTPLYLQLNNNSLIGSPSPRPDSTGSRPYSANLISPGRPSSPIRSQINGSIRSRDLFELANPPRDHKLYRAIYPYKPRQIDELELLPGDVLNVTMHCDDGWFVGHSTISGQFGTFPGNYVEPLM